MQKLTADKIKLLPMFFIVGKGRSGTTLLQTLLDANPHVHIPLESRIIIHLYKQYGDEKNWTENKILSFYNDLFGDVKFDLLWNVDREKLKQDLLEAKDEATFELLCKIVYLNYKSVFNKENIHLIGDKNPIYTIFIPELRKIFPKAKFIHLVRDYRDNIHSHMKVFKINDVAHISRKWVFYNDYIEQIKKVHPEIFYTLKYEDLVKQPESYLKEICRFLGIEYNAAMLNHQSGAQAIHKDFGSFVDKYHSNLLNPVNSTKIEVWKKEMKKEDIEIVESIAGEYAIKYGYARSLPKKNYLLKKATSYLKLKLWFLIIKNYYHLPLIIRKANTKLLKLLFGKDYQKKRL